MPLLRRRPVLRAAAVGGGAYALGKRRARMQAEQQDETHAEGQQAAMAPAAPAAPGSGGITSQDTERLAELGRLHESGVLTDEEFAQQKARILGTA